MPLSAEKQLQLLALEYTIQRGLATSVDVRNAFCEIRDARLYRQEFRTFRDYCRKRWGMDPDQQGLPQR
jgi:hypothetical protein